MLTRLVNGERIELTAEEETATREEWAENDRLQAIEDAKPKQPTIEERLSALENK